MTGEIYILGRTSFGDRELFDVSFSGLTPPATHSWTAARIEETTAWSGPWDEVETLTLTGAAPYSLTTTTGSFEAGLFRVVFTDGEGHEYATDPLERRASTWHDVRPPIRDIENLLRARQTDEYGNEVEGFTVTTRPRRAQVEQFIDQATDLFLLAVGQVPPAMRGMARTVVALGAATLVEPSYFPEQANTDQSVHDQYSAMYLSALDSFKASIAAGNTGSGLRPSWGSIPILGMGGARSRDQADVWTRVA